MENEKLKITVQDIQTGQTLLECALNEAEKAYEFAAQMDEVGLDVKVINPTLSDTLTSSLGLSKAAKIEYNNSLDDEIEHHEGSCCFEDQDKSVH